MSDFEKIILKIEKLTGKGIFIRTGVGCEWRASSADFHAEAKTIVMALERLSLFIEDYQRRQGRGE